MRRTLTSVFAATALTACAGVAAPPSAVVSMQDVSAAGVGAGIGEISLANSGAGVRLHVKVHGLPPGDHGMHLHANGSCEAAANSSGQMTAAAAAGGHFDPMQTGHHAGPMGDGHLGDLPLLHVGADGAADVTLVAPRLHSVDALRGHAIVIHANGDNYSDTPAPLGGGGARIACGVVR